jgi:hypothetical protein
MLQLLHSDVCGPMQVPSLGGGRYVVTVLDDFFQAVGREVHYCKK